MKHFTLFLLAVFFTFNVYSQQNTFSKVLVDLNRSVNEHTSLPTFDNGHLIVGNTEWTINKGMILKVDSNGDFLWAKTFIDSEFPSDWATFEFTSAINTIDSVHLISGYYYNLQSEKSEGVCTKITQDGDTIWTTTIVAEHNLELNAVCQTSDSGYVVTGNINWHESRGSIKKLFVAKLSPEGVLEWSKEYSKTDNEIDGLRVLQTEDGNLLIAGNIYYGDKSFLVKMSETGTVQWAKEYRLNEMYDRVDFQDIIEADSGFVIHSFVNGYAALIKTDTAGAVVWEKTYNSSGWPSGMFQGLKLNLCRISNGDFVFVSNLDFDGRLIKTDSQGILIFNYGLFIMPAHISETNNKELFITGNGPFPGVLKLRDENPEIGIIQLDSLGNGEDCVYDQTASITYDTLIVTTINLTVADVGNNGNTNFNVNDVSIPQRNGCISVGSGMDENKIKKPLKVYPNPAAGMVTFESLNDKSGRLLIFNTLGKNIINLKTENYKTTLDLSGYGAGVYYYQFIDKAGRSVGGKVVIE